MRNQRDNDLKTLLSGLPVPEGVPPEWLEGTDEEYFERRCRELGVKPVTREDLERFKESLKGGIADKNAPLIIIDSYPRDCEPVEAESVEDTRKLPYGAPRRPKVAPSALVMGLVGRVGAK